MNKVVLFWCQWPLGVQLGECCQVVFYEYLKVVCLSFCGDRGKDILHDLEQVKVVVPLLVIFGN